MTGDKVKEFSDYLVTYEVISNAADVIIEQYDIENKSYSKAFERLTFKDLENNIEVIIRKDFTNNKAIYIVRNLFEYERKGNIFSDMSDKELLNVVLYAPPHKMCDDGYPSKSRHWAEYGYSYIEVKLRYYSEHEHTYCKKICFLVAFFCF